MCLVTALTAVLASFARLAVAFRLVAREGGEPLEGPAMTDSPNLLMMAHANLQPPGRDGAMWGFHPVRRVIPVRS